MTEKQYSQERINEVCNQVLLSYLTAFQNDRMTIMEYSLVENVIIKIQTILEEKE